MVEVIIKRVEDTTLEHIASFIEAGGRVVETPHMGQALDGRFHFTALGDFSTEIDVVDSIKVKRDRFGNVGVIDGLNVVSNGRGEQAIAASMRSFEVDDAARGTASVTEVRTKLAELGLEADKYIKGKNVDLVEVYMATVKEVAPIGIPVRSYSEIFSGDVGRALMEHGAQNNWFKRFYDAEHNKVIQIGGCKNQSDLYREFGAYFDHQETAAGIIPDVEDIFAIAEVQAIMDGCEEVAHHIGRVAAEYTKEIEFKHRLTAATLGACGELGITGKIHQSLFISGDEVLNGIDGQPNHFDILKNAELQRRGLQANEL